jgi:hypothetical protein
VSSKGSLCPKALGSAHSMTVIPLFLDPHSVRQVAESLEWNLAVEREDAVTALEHSLGPTGTRTAYSQSPRPPLFALVALYIYADSVVVSHWATV